MTRYFAPLTLAMVLFAADRSEAHPAPYGHTHVTSEQCKAAEATGLFRCIENLEASRRDRDRKQIDEIQRILDLNLDERELLHREITGMGYDFHEVLQIARDMFRS